MWLQCVLVLKRALVCIIIVQVYFNSWFFPVFLVKSRETRICHEQKECDAWLQQRDRGPAEPLVTGTHWEQ